LKKFVALLLSVVLLLPAFGASVSAGDKNTVSVYVEGEPVLEGLKVSDTFYVPIGLYRNFGMSISAKKNDRTISKKGTTITFTVGKKTAKVNGKSQAIAAPFVKGGTTYVPARLVATSTGNRLSWIKDLNMIHIYSSKFKGKVYDYPDEGFGYTLHSDGTASIYELDPNKPNPIDPNYVIEEEEEPGYKGYPDSSDSTILWNEMHDLPKPPLLSEGWISMGMLAEIEHIKVGINQDTMDKMSLYKTTIKGIDYLHIFQLPEAFKETQDGDFTIDEIRIKRSSGYIYFNISDLQKAQIIE